MKKLLLLVLLSTAMMAAAQPTVGLLEYNIQNTEGYVLFSPMQTHKTFLINKCGEKINEWNSGVHPGLACYLLPDGNMLRAGIDSTNVSFGISGGIIEKYDWAGNLVWSYTLSSTTECQHHDIHQMPNGNILMIAWEKKTHAEALAAGRRPLLTGNAVWSEKIVEIEPSGPTTGNIVWEWHLWDHMVQHWDSTKLNYGEIAGHPELVNVNQFALAARPDWIHLNSVDYNPDLDQIVLSAHVFSEIWIIDHSTTTAQAASHAGGLSGKGGDLLYRWGNPIAYGRGTTADKKFFGQHNAQWIKPGTPDAGKIIVFNNGLNRIPIEYSSIDIISPPIDVNNNYSIDTVAAFMPDTLFWTYSATNPIDFFSTNISGVEPLTNGSFLICSGFNGHFFEIDPHKNTKWQYTNPFNINGAAEQGTPPEQNQVFRASFYLPSYAGLAGQILTPLGEIETNPTIPSICDALGVGIETVEITKENLLYPNPTQGILHFNLPQGKLADNVEVTNGFGQVVMQDRNKTYLDVSSLPSGIYFIRIQTEGLSRGEKIIKY